MKRYLLTAMVLVFVGVNASDNPFDLSVNLKKIDQDQDAILSELKDMAEAKEERAERTEENIEKVEKIKVDNTVPAEAKVTEEERIKEERLQQEYAEIRRVRLEKGKAEKAKLEAEKLAQLEAEKAKSKSEKFSKEKQEATKKSDIADINITREGIEAARESDKTYKRAIIQVDKEKNLAQLKVEKEKQEASNKSVIADINITREEIESTKEADKAYREAVIEMDKED